MGQVATNNEVAQLVLEIFQFTGQKVEIDDPIVVAALIQSQMIRRAGREAVADIEAAVGRAVVDLTQNQSRVGASRGLLPTATTWIRRFPLWAVMIAGSAGGVIGANWLR